MSARVRFATTLAALFLIGLAPCAIRAEGNDEAGDAERIARRIEDVFQRHMDGLQDDLRGLIRSELSRSARPGRELPVVTPGAHHAAITTAELLAHVTHLAGDDLEGRGSTQDGVWRAAEYLSAQFARLGLKPVGDAGTYLQAFSPAKGAKAPNVVGLLEGSDPDVRDEVIVVGAHYDHLGVGHGVGDGRLDQLLGGAEQDDQIYNGADDNASGTAAVLEAAEALIPARPRRSVLFILFAGEEMGLLGSRHYVRKPLLPLDATVAMINLDMVGRNPKRPLDVIAAESSPELKRIFAEKAAELGMKIKFTGQGIMGGSDHQSFYPKNIPVAHLFSGLHKDYHRASDHVEKISPEQMERAAKLTAAVVEGLAELPERPRFKRVMSMEFSRLLELFGSGGGGEGGRVFGIGTAEDASGGVEVTTVAPDSAAEACGVEPGDVIVEFGGTKLGDDPARALTRLRKAIRDAAAGEDLRVVVERDGKRVTLTARFEE